MSAFSGVTLMTTGDTASFCSTVLKHFLTYDTAPVLTPSGKVVKIIRSHTGIINRMM